jgi:proton-translocating NAD(P)+ transhydrogenase subunit beta
MLTDEQRPGADERSASLVPVVVSLLTALAGICSAAAGLASGNTVMMFAGMILGGMGSVLIQLIVNAMSRRPRSMRTRKVSGASHFVHRGGR